MEIAMTKAEKVFKFFEPKGCWHFTKFENPFGDGMLMPVCKICEARNPINPDFSTPPGENWIKERLPDGATITLDKMAPKFDHKWQCKLTVPINSGDYTRHDFEGVGDTPADALFNACLKLVEVGG